MAIAFNCPHCNLFYRLKDELAGKRATCKNPDCRKVIVIPQPATVPSTSGRFGELPSGADGKDNTPPPVPHVDVEAAAMAALADAPKEEKPAAEQEIPVTCDYCSHQWTEPAEKGGKNVLCRNPECRQRVKVPLPKTETVQDWREKPKAPSLAKENFEKPKDVIDAQAQVVSKKAWDAGGGAEQFLEPIPLSRRIYFGLLIGAPIVGLVLGVVYLWRTTKEERNDRLMADALKEYKETTAGDLIPAQASLYSAMLQIAAGEYSLKSNLSREDFKNAMDHFTQSRADLQKSATEDDRKVTAGERYAIACELAVATLGLGSSNEDEVASGARCRWLPEAPSGRRLRINEKNISVHGELQRTLQLLQGADFDVKAALARRLARGLMKWQQAELAGNIPVMLFAEPEQAEGKAIVALEIYRQDRASPVCQQIANELKAQLEKGVVNKNPMPASAQVLWKVLGMEKVPVFIPMPPPPPQPVPNDSSRFAYVGMYLLQDKPAEALDLARRTGQLAGQLRALVLYAEWAADPTPAFDAALTTIELQTKGKKEAPQPPSNAVLRLSQLAAAAGKADQARQLAAAIPDEGLKEWAMGDAIRQSATPENKTPADASSTTVPDDPKKLRAGHAWGRFWVARHNMRLTRDQSKLTKEVATWPKGTVHPFGMAGIAVGLME